MEPAQPYLTSDSEPLRANSCLTIEYFVLLLQLLPGNIHVQTDQMKPVQEGLASEPDTAASVSTLELLIRDLREQHSDTLTGYVHTNLWASV